MNLLCQTRCSHVDKRSCGENVNYMSDQAAEEEEARAKVITNETEKEIQQSRFLSVLVDESTDISVTQKLVVCVRFVAEDFLPKTRFLKNLSDGKAATILDTLKAVLAEKRLPHPVLSKVFGLGSDGAAVMTGVKGGVSGLMKNENPMHCLAHRLALCTSQAATDIPALKGYQQIITDIYHTFSL